MEGCEGNQPYSCIKKMAKKVKRLVSIEETISFIDKLPPESTASMQRDIMDGRPSELHEQSGAVVRYGEKVDVTTPVNWFIYHSLLPQERKSREEISF